MNNLTFQQSVDIAVSKEAPRHCYVLDKEGSRKTEEAEMFQSCLAGKLGGNHKARQESQVEEGRVTKKRI